MKPCLSATSTFIFFICSICQAQEDLKSRYADFAASAREEYSSKADSNRLSFIETLQMNWETFNVYSEHSRRRMTPPVVRADSTASPQTDISLDIFGVPVDENAAAPTNSVFDTNPSDVPLLSNTRRHEFKVFDYQVFVNVPLVYAHLSLKDTKESSVADTWAELARLDNGILLCDILSVISRLGLNDWGSYNLVCSCMEQLFPASHNLQVVGSVYFLNKLGLDCRIARATGGLSPIFSSRQLIYGKRYIVLDGRPYYIDCPLSGEMDRLQTYGVSTDKDLRPLDMELTASPSFAESRSLFENKWHTDIFGDDVNFSFNNCLLKMYATYPQTSFSVYARAVPDKSFSGSLLGCISGKIKGLSNVEALERILKMMHQDFEYKTDSEQFGFEKVFFCEENFHYRYNDCEDRAVLFSFLVRSLLGLDVVLLEYPDHVCCAVAVDGIDKGMFIKLQQRKFYVCDPAYIGASVGMGFKPANVKPEKIWVL